VLDWPLLAAVGHTGGAAALVVVLTWIVSSRYSAPAAAAPRSSFAFSEPAAQRPAR
jgi:cytochrome c oxidase assembly protein subunit 15